MKLQLVIILCLSILISCAHSEKKHHHKHHRFDNAKKWSKIFEDPKRDKWQKPDLVIKELKLDRTMKVADIGAATGYFPVRLAKHVPQGRVWAVDIEPNLVSHLNERARKEKLNNLFSILGSYGDPLIPEKVDRIIIVDTYHHIEKRHLYFDNLKHYLSKGGQVAIVDFKKEDLPMGPPKKMKLSKNQVIEEMQSFGHKLIKDSNVLPYQYFLIFSPSK